MDDGWPLPCISLHAALDADLGVIEIVARHADENALVLPVEVWMPGRCIFALILVREDAEPAGDGLG